jgi:hypothetical protein
VTVVRIEEVSRLKLVDAGTNAGPGGRCASFARDIEGVSASRTAAMGDIHRAIVTPGARVALLGLLVRVYPTEMVGVHALVLANPMGAADGSTLAA